jgi:hypothetical protein
MHWSTYERFRAEALRLEDAERAGREAWERETIERARSNLDLFKQELKGLLRTADPPPATRPRQAKIVRRRAEERPSIGSDFDFLY